MRACISFFESWVKFFSSLASLGKEVAHRPSPKSLQTILQPFSLSGKLQWKKKKKRTKGRKKNKLALSWQGFGSICNVGRARSCWVVPFSLEGESNVQTFHVEWDFSSFFHPLTSFWCMVCVWHQDTKQRNWEEMAAWSISFMWRRFSHTFVFPSNTLEERQSKLQQIPRTIFSPNRLWRQEE